MMKLRSSRWVSTRATQKQDESPFLPRMHEVVNGTGPRLKFDSPEKTEEWLASREKTEYTYSKSASYSVDSQISNYEVPIMSRVSRGSFLRDTSSPARHVQLQGEATASPNRRSSRLAQKYGLHDTSTSSRLNQSQNRSLHVSHSESHSTTNLHTSSSNIRYNDGGQDEVWPSSTSTLASSASRLARGTAEVTARSGMYHQVHHNSGREHSINHMYGLDGNEESEISDTESSSAVLTGTSSRTSGRWSTVDHTHHSQSSTLFFPLTLLTTIMTSVVWVFTTVERMFLARTIYGSSAAGSSTSAASSTDTVSSRLAYVCSRSLEVVSVTVYRCVTYLMCIDVWGLIYTKATTLALLGGLASLLGLGSASQADGTTAAMTSAMLLEKQRKRRSCCLCLLLLFGTLASSYLLLVAPLLMAVSRNETKTDSVLHTIDEQYGLLVDKIRETSSGDDDDGGAAAFMAGTGCLQCLKQGDLLALIGGVVKGQLDDLKSEVASQKQQIMSMQQLRINQEIQIKDHQEQLSHLTAAHIGQGRPNDRTFLYLNTMEGQLTRVRGQLRNLQLSRLRGEQDSSKESAERSTIIVGLSDDLQLLGKDVAGLQEELESFHTQQVLEISKAQQESKHMHDELYSINVSMLSWEERLSVNITFLEMKLKGLLNDLELLKLDGRQSMAKLEELIKRANSFESGLSDVKVEVRNFKSEFGDFLATRERREKTDAVDSRLELMRSDFASFRASHGDTDKSLNELQNKYQTLGALLGRVQVDVKDFHSSMEDLGTQRVGALESNFKQLNTKLAKLDTDFSSLQVNFLTLQGTASGMVDKNGIESLQESLSQSQEQLSVFVADVDSLKLQIRQLRSQLEDVRTSHEEHKVQAGAAFQELRSDIGELNIKSDRMVVLENLQGNADSNSLVKQLSEELGSVRLDLRRVASLEGDSNLVAEVNNLRESLTSAKSQVNYFDTTQMQMTRTFTSSISDLRDDISEMNRAIEEQKATSVGFNATVSSLQQGQDKLAAFATRKQLEDLENEMVNVKATIGKLSTAQSVYATTGDIDSLKSQITNVKLQVNNIQVQLTEMSDAYMGEASSYASLAADLAKMQGTVNQLEAMLYVADKKPISLSLLESRISDLTSMVQDNDKNLAAFLAAGGTRASTSSHDAIVVLQQDFAAIRSDTDRLTGVLFLQGADGESTNVMAGLLDRTAVLETSIAQTNVAGVDAGAGAGLNQDIRIQRLQSDVNNLKEDMMRQSVLHSAGADLGVLGASIQNDMKEVKANITRLQVDVYKCCKNKTGLLGWWSSPWFGGGQGSAAGGVNFSAVGNMDEEAVKHIVLSALNIYSADKTGMVDYALESAGGSVISTRCSETHHSKTALLSIFGIPLWYLANSPRTVIQPDVQPGNCWAFKGTQGYMVIQLAGIIKPSAFSMEHIPKSLSPTGTIESAPKEFSVWGLQDEDDTKGVLLGEYAYDQDGSPLQFFPIERGDVEPIPAVELKIHSNHGNLEYTCLYRFRVHGTLDRR